MQTETKDILRRYVFKPYRKGMGPVFRLVTWDTHRSSSDGKSCIGYKLAMTDGKARTVLFEGEDFYNSPMHCIDSDETAAGLMSFLTLRPGDTDAEYFSSYTHEQLDYCGNHAEALQMECWNRFGEV